MPYARIAGYALCLCVSAAALVLAKTPADAGAAATKEISGWGKWVDPDGDCDVRAEGKGAIVISVPASPHDLWPENPEPKQRTNAPRLVQDADGDFTVEVNVTGQVLGGEFFRSGALVIWQDERNFVRFERAGSFRGKTPRHYCWLHVFKDGKRVTNLQKEPVKDADTILRLSRRGDKLDASFSQDGGKEFFKYPQQEVKLEPRVKVGVAALNASKAPFDVRFELIEGRLTRKP